MAISCHKLRYNYVMYSRRSGTYIQTQTIKVIVMAMIAVRNNKLSASCYNKHPGIECGSVVMTTAVTKYL